MNSTTAAAREPRVSGSVQECSAALVRPKIRANRPRVTVTAPGTSSRCFMAGLLSARTAGAMRSTAAATGTLMKNAHRQLSRSVSSPPRMAPVVKPAAMSEPLSPRALSRKGPSGKEFSSSDRAAGTTMAVAMPCPTQEHPHDHATGRNHRARCPIVAPDRGPWRRQDDQPPAAGAHRPARGELHPRRRLLHPQRCPADVGADVGFSLENLQWIATAFALCAAGFTLLFGRVADLAGRRKMFLIGMALLGAASVAGGLAATPVLLLIARP
jgi:hypothetical protein